MTSPLSRVITRDLLAALRATYALNWDGIHGIRHWLRVRENGLRLAEGTGADVVVVELFAFVHDIRRLNDGRDPEHGARAAAWMRAEGRALIDLDPQAFDRLAYACAYHTAGLIEADVTVQTCWDADRLDLGRVGITPVPHRLCTPTARRPDVIAWALRRSQEGG